MPFVSTPDFPVEKGQREPQNPAGFGGNAALRRPQDPPKISWDPLQLEFRSNLSPLELGQLSLVRDYCQFRAWAAKNNFKIHQNNFVLCWPLKGSAEVESSSSLVWRKENFFFQEHFRAGPIFKLQKFHLELSFSCVYFPWCDIKECLFL